MVSFFLNPLVISVSETFLIHGKLSLDFKKAKLSKLHPSKFTKL